MVFVRVRNGHEVLACCCIIGLPYIGIVVVWDDGIVEGIALAEAEEPDEERN